MYVTESPEKSRPWGTGYGKKRPGNYTIQTSAFNMWVRSGKKAVAEAVPPF